MLSCQYSLEYLSQFWLATKANPPFCMTYQWHRGRGADDSQTTCKELPALFPVGEVRPSWPEEDTSGACAGVQ